MIYFKPQHQDSVLNNFQENVQFCKNHKQNIEPSYEIMEAWEKKEYEDSYLGVKAEMQEQLDFMTQEKSVFNKILSEYNHTLNSFIIDLY